MRRSDAAVERVYEELGGKIKEARLGVGLTQTELGQRVGLTRSSIANVEAGRQRAMLHTLMNVADALQTSLAQLLPETGEEALAVSLVDPDELEGWPTTTHDFVNSAMSRAIRR